MNGSYSYIFCDTIDEKKNSRVPLWFLTSSVFADFLRQYVFVFCHLLYIWIQNLQTHGKTVA